MSSWISIANRALYKLGSNGITSLADTQSADAIAVNDILDDVLDEVLCLHPWNCALERSTLAQDAAAPSWGFDYSYSLPADPWCLRVVRLDDLSVTWKVIGRHLYTDAAAPLYAEWIRRITDPNEMSPWVRTAFVEKLAYELAYRRTNSGALAEKLEEGFWKRVLPTCRGTDGQEGTEDEFEVTDFVEARL